ncbi:hypothetical protein PIB30_040434 [Stylosanthes scabra]|uniref:Uncharacterized protein n=1 Tax=Stylosanthes scabra TaxID=79078 RepID=A0ABU6TEA8_9FABA|nr:hypothetical protein [Stylosanthes scabra]
MLAEIQIRGCQDEPGLGVSYGTTENRDVTHVASLGLLSSPASHQRSWSFSFLTHPHTLIQGRFALMLRLKER